VAVGLCLVALLAVSVVSLTVARDGTSGVADASAVASDASDLYFALADLDAQSARLVLLGNGAAPAGSKITDFGSNSLVALNSYNERTAQVDADLHSLAVHAQSADEATVSRLTAGVTEYHQIADAAIGLDETVSPQAAAGGAATGTATGAQALGAPAGQPDAAAIGYYARATTLMQAELLPTAKRLRDGRAGALSSAASSAHTAGIIGAATISVMGLAALGVALAAHRRMARWFRRSVNLGLVLATVLILALTAAGAAALFSAARDGSAAGNRFSDYLAVARARTDSYDADGAATRYLLTPDTGTTALNADVATTNKDLAALGPDPLIQQASARWRQVANTDLATVAADAVGDPATALVLDTGNARGQEAFDFFYYDSELVSASDQRLAAFDGAMSAARGDLSGWSWLPWVLVGCALAGLALGVRPRLAEYR
jgi:hypothetical protein